ncbi:uncharacterized protein LOC142339302 isoform X2 [Convolutriloba macropyga]|uniref:uncharacterized protein LOC142339302 isoform X2 n=1 Tax=Convolutriloba macropyga TaxID=536237 RepID=UPI003F51FBFD
MEPAGDQALKSPQEPTATIDLQPSGHEKKAHETQPQMSAEAKPSVEETDSPVEDVEHLNIGDSAGAQSTREPLPVLPCLPSTTSKQSTSGASGWGSWAASLLTNALQLDEEDDEVEPVTYQNTSPDDIVSAQPEVALPTEQTRIERGAAESEPEAAEGSGGDVDSSGQPGYGQYLSGISGWGSGWVTGALNTAKQQSVTAAEFLKRDLNEFATVVKKDTTDLATSTTKTLQTTLNVSDESVGKFKGDVSYLFGSVKSTLYSTTAQFYQLQGDEDGGVRNPVKMAGVTPTPENSLEGKLEALYRDPKTFTTTPADSEAFEAFCSAFKVDSVKSEISALLVEHTELRMLYSRLVPSEVSHMDFWSRLWFKRQLLENEAERKTELLSKVQTSLHGDLLDWGDEEEEEQEEEGKEKDVKQAAISQPPGNATKPKESDSSSNNDGWGEDDDDENEADELERNVRKAKEAEKVGGTTTDQSGQSRELSVHIDPSDDSLQHIESAPDSSTSDEWEKDFEDCRS